MKLLCETVLRYRQSQSNSNNRPQKSTIVLGQHSKKENKLSTQSDTTAGLNSDSVNVYLILFTPSNQTGTRYKLTDNIEKLFVRFMNDGKITISLKEPEHDILVKSEPIQLKCFLQTLRIHLQSSSSTTQKQLITNDSKLIKSASSSQPSRLNLIAAARPIAASAYPIKKLFIRTKSDYPLRGFPRTIQELIINGIKRTKFDSQIFFLKNLTKLYLNDNCIEFIPKQLGQMQIVDLNLAQNCLGGNDDGTGRFSGDTWQWTDNEIIRKSLKTLNLCGNNLRYFPNKLVKLQNLTVLKLDNNQINQIPFEIRRMKKLKFLHISKNKLTSLPHTLNRCSLDTLDISDNQFPTVNVTNVNTVASVRLQPKVRNLLQLAGRVVSANRLPYSPLTLPICLINLLEETPLCPCGLICFSTVIYEKCIPLNLNCIHLISNMIGTFMLLGDSVFCSVRCATRYSLRN